MGLSGFEPLTSRLSAVRSSQLSYRPVEPLHDSSARDHVRGLLRLLEERTLPKSNARPKGQAAWLPENWVDEIDNGENELGWIPLERR